MEENQEQNQNANGGAQYQGTMNNGNVNAQYQGAMNNANGNVQYQAGANNLNGTFDTERLKTETASTVNQVKETFKNVNIKQDSIETKKEFLHKNHIALYDSILSCEIKSSSDSSIRKVVPTNLKEIVDNSKIKMIFLP